MAGLFFSIGGNTGNAPAATTPYAGLIDPALAGLLPSGSATPVCNWAAIPNLNPAPAGIQSPYGLTAGTLIPASLITGINSDLPGSAMAQVTNNIYDSVNGRVLLIPQGSKLLGSYAASNNHGQTRVQVSWQQLILPNGISVTLDNLPALDGQGYAGLTGKVDNHRDKLAGGAAIASLLGIGAELATSSEDRIINALQGSAGNTVNQAGQRIVDKSVNIKPTITIAPGTRFSLMLTSDLSLNPYR